MRFFVTGASGHLASAVVPELLGAGHQVLGLVRSDRSAAALTAAGAKAHRGALDDLDSVREAALAADGVVHLAYIHDPVTQGLDAAAADLKAIETIGAALEGSDKPFVGTSGTLVLSPGRVGTEDDALGPDAPAALRIAAENAAVALAKRRIRSSVVRLPPSVHSSLDEHGFVPRLISIARDKGTSAYIGEGTNRWPAVHTLDAASAVPAGRRVRAGGRPAPRSGRPKRAIPRHRLGHRTTPRSARCRDLSRRGRRSFRLAVVRCGR